ncbi:hypothetical protein IFM89_019434, partial [Coptis chinensis]
GLLRCSQGTGSKLAQAKGCRNKEDQDRLQKLKDKAIELKVEKDVEFYKNLMYRTHKSYNSMECFVREKEAKFELNRVSNETMVGAVGCWINHDPMTAQMQRMRSQVEQLQAELLYFCGEGGTPSEELQDEVKRFAMVDTSTLKQHYEKKLHEMEQEKKALMRETDDLRSNISFASNDGAQKLKETYLQKLNFLEAQFYLFTSVRVEEEARCTISTPRRKQRKVMKPQKRLRDEIHRIKTQKKIKQESEQFRLWKASREKEVL